MTLTTPVRKYLVSIDFWNQVCIHTGKKGVQAEHALFYTRKQINEPWALVPCSPDCNYNPSKETKEKSAYVAMLQCKRMGEWENAKIKYPRKDWDKEYELLDNKYRNAKMFLPNILLNDTIEW